MLTGTPLDLTPFDGLLAALGWIYWLAAAAIVLLALWWPKRWWLKLASALFVAVAVVYPLFVRPVDRHIAAVQAEREQSKARLDAAMAHFEMRCQSAGEKIVRTVEKVEGVVWMKWRDKYDISDDHDQFKLFDPYGRDCDDQTCIENLLRLDAEGGRFVREVAMRKGRYRSVESIDPSDGKRYRYVGAMVPRWSDAGVRKHRQETGQDIPDDAYWFKHAKQPIDKFSARYGITWNDISTREDREVWVAGGSLKVVDLQTNEVIAERIGYMVDRGQGSRAGFRSPWVGAVQLACPAFPQVGPTDPRRNRDYRDTATLRFVLQVLKPSKE